MGTSRRSRNVSSTCAGSAICRTKLGAFALSSRGHSKTTATGSRARSRARTCRRRGGWTRIARTGSRNDNSAEDGRLREADRQFVDALLVRLRTADELDVSVRADLDDADGDPFQRLAEQQELARDERLLRLFVVTAVLDRQGRRNEYCAAKLVRARRIRRRGPGGVRDDDRAPEVDALRCRIGEDGVNEAEDGLGQTRARGRPRRVG